MVAIRQREEGAFRHRSGRRGFRTGGRMCSFARGWCRFRACFACSGRCRRCSRTNRFSRKHSDPRARSSVPPNRRSTGQSSAARSAFLPAQSRRPGRRRGAACRFPRRSIWQDADPGSVPDIDAVLRVPPRRSLCEVSHAPDGRERPLVCAWGDGGTRHPGPHAHAGRGFSLNLSLHLRPIALVARARQLLRPGGPQGAVPLTFIAIDRLHPPTDCTERRTEQPPWILQTIAGPMRLQRLPPELLRISLSVLGPGYLRLDHDRHLEFTLEGVYRTGLSPSPGARAGIGLGTRSSIRDYGCSVP